MSIFGKKSIECGGGGTINNNRRETNVPKITNGFQCYSQLSIISIECLDLSFAIR